MCAEGLREGLPGAILGNREVVQEARRPAQPERPSGQVPGSLLRPLIWAAGVDPKAGFRGPGLPPYSAQQATIPAPTLSGFIPRGPQISR